MEGGKPRFAPFHSSTRELAMPKKLLTALESLLKFLATLSLGIIVIFLFYAVIMRYLFHRPPAWSMELSRFLFLWMIIFSAGLVTREQSHIQIRFVVDRLPRTLRFVWSNLLRLLMLGFCLVIVKQGINIFPLVSEALTPTLGLSMGWLYSSVPVGGVLIGIYLLEAIILSAIVFFQRESSREKPEC